MTDPLYSADWFDNPHLAHGGYYGVRGPRGLVHATGPYKADWEKATYIAAEMNVASKVEGGGPHEHDLSATALSADATPTASADVGPVGSRATEGS